MPGRLLARIIHDHFCCNRGFAAATSLDAVGTASRQAGSPLSRSTYCWGQAPFFLATVPVMSSGTGTAADGGASPLASARLSRVTTARFLDEPS